MFKPTRIFSFWTLAVVVALSAVLVGAVTWSGAQERNNLTRPGAPISATPDSSHYTALTQINRSNVDQLEVAWSYDSGNERAYEFNPIVIGNVMYVIAQHSDIVALDAATGKEIWRHHPNSSGQRLEVHRGINYWQSKDGTEKRLFIPFDNHLEAIDATNGELIKSFGDGGSVDLKVGLGRDPKSMYQIQAGTPGQVFENLIIVGSETGEDYGSPPGDVRAYDVPPATWSGSSTPFRIRANMVTTLGPTGSWKWPAAPTAGAR